MRDRKISIPRLRRFCDDASAAHAALLAASERERAARAAARLAQEAVDRFEDGQHALRGNDAEIARTERRLLADLDAAREALAAATAARTDASERWSHASGLAARGRAYAAGLGVLPADMVET